MTKFYNRSTETEKRRALRKSMPPAEVLLWNKIKGRQVAGCKFRRQYSVGAYVIDFYSAEVKLGIEIDGESHFIQGAQKRDADRQTFIASFEIKIIRFQNPEIYENIDGVLETIAREVELRRNGARTGQ